MIFAELIFEIVVTWGNNTIKSFLSSDYVHDILGLASVQRECGNTDELVLYVVIE